jgi:signal transduction histidine kinase
MSTPLIPWRRPMRVARTLGYVQTGMPLAVIAFVSTVTFVSLSAGLAITFLLAIPFIWLSFVWSRGLAQVERGRTIALLGAVIGDPVPPLARPTWWGRLWERVRSRPRWKEIGHHVARLFVDTLAFALVSAAWCGSIAILLLPLYVDALPGDSAKFWFFELTAGPGALGAAAVGLLGLVVVAPWITIGFASLQLRLAQALLGVDPDAAYAREVQRLETSRSAAVDSAEAERRRIERDLHDGAQQRLVALAANLGAAREKLDHDDAAGGRAMVAEAHEEAKAALREIRDLVRGIHPVILEDRGLDAALSAVVARSPIPVELDVAVAERPPAAVESAAYFVVNEALANVARHAHATRAVVSIARAGERLVIEVRDDGQGGADPAAGTGLQGLRDRVTGLGGSMYVISPAGGPTTISVELPCGS